VSDICVKHSVWAEMLTICIHRGRSGSIVDIGRGSRLGNGRSSVGVGDVRGVGCVCVEREHRVLLKVLWQRPWQAAYVAASPRHRGKQAAAEKE